MPYFVTRTTFQGWRCARRVREMPLCRIVGCFSVFLRGACHHLQATVAMLQLPHQQAKKNKHTNMKQTHRSLMRWGVKWQMHDGERALETTHNWHSDRGGYVVTLPQGDALCVCSVVQKCANFGPNFWTIRTAENSVHSHSHASLWVANSDKSPIGSDTVYG